jgi:multicomponent Na+:H+ antiporter subunit E
MGLLSVAIVVWFLRRMDRVDGEPIRPVISIGLLSYLAWLMWCIVKSNIDLVRRIWDPALPIHPAWTRLDTAVSTPMEKTIYSNSITLTPGTLTTAVREDHFIIHSVTRESIDELHEGEMERRIRRLGV